TIHGQDFQVIFNTAEGVIDTFRAYNQDLLLSGLRENYYRAPTDIDLLMGNPPAPIHKWRAAGLERLERKLISFEKKQVSEKSVVVRVVSRVCAPDEREGFDSEIVYQVFGNGELSIDNRVKIDERPEFIPQQVLEWMPEWMLSGSMWKYFVPRVGVELRLPDRFENLTWFGRGPHENYMDRKKGAAVGRYQSTVTDQFTPYVYPSECGGKEDVRWLALSSKDGYGLMVVSQDKLHFDALRFSIRDLANAKHLDALQPRNEVILHLDGWHMGVGGDDGWWSQAHEEFLIFPGIYRYAFKLKPFAPQDDLSQIARTKFEGEI
ncbi:MAG: beta-galactosidase small subunit, partial [Anaerolineales bacterium]